MKEYLRIIGFSLLASLLIFIGKNNLTLNWFIENKVLSESIDLEKTQLVCFVIGIFWAGLWLPIQHSILKTKQKKKDQQFIELLSYNKESYFKIIKNKLNAYNVQFNTRMFRPQKGVKGWLNRNLRGKIILELITVNGVSDNFHHKTLHFEVNKNETQGLIGQCYSDKKLWVDLNLDKNKYNLTQQHISKIGDVGFCSAIPIFNKDQSKVNAILSVDSKVKFNFNKTERKDWEEHMIYYGAFVDKHTNI